MGSSRQQTWCHKTIMAKNNHYSGNFLLLRPGGNRCKPQSSYIQQKNQSLPAKCWAQSRQRSESGSEPVQSSSKTCVWNLLSLTHVIQNRYSIQEPIIYGKTTRDLHMLHANKLQWPQLYFFSFFLRQTCLIQWLWSIFSHVAHAVHKFDEFCLRCLIFPA